MIIVYIYLYLAFKYFLKLTIIYLFYKNISKLFIFNKKTFQTLQNLLYLQSIIETYNYYKI